MEPLPYLIPLSGGLMTHRIGGSTASRKIRCVPYGSLRSGADDTACEWA